MAAIVNDRDVLIGPVSPRFVPPSTGMVMGVLLSASTNVFQVTGSAGSPASITLTATLLGLSGTVTFTVSPAVTLTTTGNSTVLTFAHMGSNNSVVVKASITVNGVTYTSPQQTITKLVTLGSLATQSTVNLANQVTGALAAGNVTGLGALAVLNAVNLTNQVTGTLPSSNVSGLGALATQSSVDGYSQVTNLGNLAYANSVAANQIGAGTLAAGVIYAGNINANNINTGTLTSVAININGGQFSVGTNGLVNAYNFLGYNSTFGNTINPGVAAIRTITNSFSTAEAIRATASGSSLSNHAIRGENTNRGTAGLLGMGGLYDVYAEGTAANYGPFTGAHDALVVNDSGVEVGDLVVDVECVAVRGYSNTLFTVERSSVPCQRGVRGVIAAVAGRLGEAHPPAAMVDGRSTIIDDGENATTIDVMCGRYYELADTHTLVAMNAVGEGSIRVCGEGGAIGPDDLLVTSSIPGVAMRQADDIIRGYTVAKARVGKGETVGFTGAAEVKILPCIYLCG